MFSQTFLIHLLHEYGYLFVAAVVFFESMGLPLPGESMLIAAALYAATTHHMNIFFIVPAAAVGAILGDNAGFGIGHWLGVRVVARWGRKIGLSESRIKLGRYLFQRHGGKVVFFGRFVAVLRTFAAVLAGANGMHWKTFLIWNAAGGIAWSCVYGFGAYFLGNAIKRIEGPAGIVLGVLGVGALIAAFIFLKRHEHKLTKEAESAAHVS